MNDFLKLTHQKLEKEGFVFCDLGIWIYKDDLYCLHCGKQYIPEEVILLIQRNSEGVIDPSGLHIVVPCNPHFHYYLDAAITSFIAEFKKLGCDFPDL